ncbi:hypothetical protein ACFVH0_16930 [Streptomyces sp. NPDC127117]|uniref:hypothetical protein n=1 Tax=Streptomyces sp. NPDC127117 TaxID=3345368 RepID=UPI00362C7F70
MPGFLRVVMVRIAEPVSWCAAFSAYSRKNLVRPAAWWNVNELPVSSGPDTRAKHGPSAVEGPLQDPSRSRTACL